MLTGYFRCFGLSPGRNLQGQLLQIRYHFVTVTLDAFGVRTLRNIGIGFLSGLILIIAAACAPHPSDVPKSSVTSKIKAKSTQPEAAKPKKSDAETPQKLYMQALDSFNRGNYGAALNQLDAVLAKDPHFPAAYVTKGDVYQARQETKLAVRNYNLALDKDPHLIKARLNLGQLYEEQGEYALARKEYSEVLRQIPQHPQALKNLQRIQGETTPQAAFIQPVQPPEAAMKSSLPAQNLPKEYSQIAGTAAINRGQLAALLAINLKIPADHLPASGIAVISDISDHWAREYILYAVGHNLMQEFPNHNFLPDAALSRAEVAEITSHILNLLGQPTGREHSQPDDPAYIEFQDVPVKNQFYQAVQCVSFLKIMPPVSTKNFGLTQSLSGQEALEIIARLSSILQKL